METSSPRQWCSFYGIGTGCLETSIDQPTANKRLGSRTPDCLVFGMAEVKLFADGGSDDNLERGHYSMDDRGGDDLGGGEPGSDDQAPGASPLELLHRFDPSIVGFGIVGLPSNVRKNHQGRSAVDRNT